MGTGTVDRPFAKRQKSPFTPRAKGLRAVYRAWETEGVFRDVVLDHAVDPREMDAAPFPDDLAPQIRRALQARGIDQLYRHQLRALELGRAGNSFVVATPTASGKSLCYNLPILDRLAQDADARALYLFPTKALSRDQEQALRALLSEADLAHGAITYDGDTPGDARRVARERGGVILTNPDMLHSGILPHHTSWARFFSNLRFIVVDELHAYRGVFGSHLANVMRRLHRICQFHGSDPTFVLSSATIGNPAEHAQRIVGRPIELIDESGAPQGPRRVLVYNPPIVNAELGLRASYLKTTVRMACDLVKARVPTLVFGQSRNAVEVMLKYLRDRLKRDKSIDPNVIMAYRGGYLPQERRAIEARLRSGDIRCVVATNALELGIDIGALDAVLCAGYPGTIAGTWQRFGRAGRRESPSLGMLITNSMPLDQFVARDAQQLVEAPVEQARIDPDNVEILIQHLKCAAFELPFEEGDRFGDLPTDSLTDALTFLSDHGVVHPQGTTWHWATDHYPANDVSLRALSWDNFVIIDLDTDLTIAEMDWRSTHTMLHVQAIYQHDAEQYQVERLDYENHKAYVRKVKPDYYTTAMKHTKITVLEEDDGAVIVLPRPLSAGRGEVSVVQKVVGYKKIKFHTHDNVGYGDVHLPEMQMHTTAYWLTFPEPVIQAFLLERCVTRPVVIDALRGLLNSMHLLAAMGLMVDPRDLGHAMGSSANAEPLSAHGAQREREALESRRGDPRGSASWGEGSDEPSRWKVSDDTPTTGSTGFDPTLFLYDAIPGGIGLSPRLFEERESLLRRARTSIAGCECESGCPACIGPTAGHVGESDREERKALVLSLLDFVGLTSLH